MSMPCRRASALHTLLSVTLHLHIVHPQIHFKNYSSYLHQECQSNFDWHGFKWDWTWQLSTSWSGRKQELDGFPLWGFWCWCCLRRCWLGGFAHFSMFHILALIGTSSDIGKGWINHRWLLPQFSIRSSFDGWFEFILFNLKFYSTTSFV